MTAKLKFTQENIVVTRKWGQLIIWLNIVIQLLFPLACAFTPAMTAASTKQHGRAHPIRTTHVYVLKPGENVNNIASRFGITLNELRQLNQFRHSGSAFDHLRTGEVIDVPAHTKTGLPELGGTNARNQGDNASENDGAALEKEQSDPSHEWQSRAAGTLSGIGSSLSSRSHSQSQQDVFADMATSMAAGQASAEIENWMRHYGNARVQVSADRNLSLSNAQADLLLPVWEYNENLLYTQMSVHRTDRRLQSNLGLGWRYFAPTWMAGTNAFFDYDYSHGHTRAGQGLEFWRDYLKLSSNAYYRLSGWKNSDSLEDYEERPANGWDVRAEAWLPAYPQVGGKLTWEQYYGHEVGISSATSREKDPHKFTAGLAWTPVPLVTLTTERSMGNGRDDARVGIEFRWQPGLTLSQQLDSTSVGEMRTLAGSRYDFVSRNNNIVLEYRKKEVIFLTLPEKLIGRSGSEVALHATVRSTHALGHITWQTSEFSAAGGKIADLGGGNYQLTLPPFTTGTTGRNSWTISAVATDSKGNQSLPARTVITALSGQLSITKSSLTPTDTNLPADGKTVQTLILTLRDDNDVPVDISSGSISLSQVHLSGAENSARVALPERQGPGVYRINVTASTASGSFRLTPAVAGQALPSATIHVAGVLDAGKSSMSASSPVLVANGRDFSQIRFVARDAQGESVGGLNNVRFSLTTRLASGMSAGASSPAYSLSPVISDGQGVYTATVRGLQAGIVTLRPQIDGQAVGDLSTQITFNSDASSGQLVTFTRDKSHAKANGDDVVDLVASVRDAQGNPVAGAVVAFSASSGAKVSTETMLTDKEGNAKVSVTSTQTGDSVVTAMLQTHTLTQHVFFEADSKSAQIPEGYLVVLKDNVTADGVDVARIGILLTDKQHNPLPGIAVTLSADNGATLNNSTPASDRNGEVYASLTDARAGTVIVTAAINGVEHKVPVHFVADSRTSRIQHIELKNDNAAANGSSPVTVLATVTDAKGNLLPHINVGFDLAGKAQLSASSSQTNDQGQAIVDIRSVNAGSFNVTASTGSSSQSSLVHFSPDIKSARIEKGYLIILADHQPAGGQNRVGLLVTDARRNPVSNVAVRLSANNGATITPQNVKTDDHGEVYATVSSTHAGNTHVTAALENGSQDTVSVGFIAEAKTAQVETLTMTGGDVAPADNHTPVHLQVTVADRYGNRVPGVNIALSAEEGVMLDGFASGHLTDAGGIINFTAVSNKVGEFTVHARGPNGAEKTRKIHFISDLASVRVRGLTVEHSGQPADNVSEETLKAQVSDNQGNPAPDGVLVHFDLPAKVHSVTGPVNQAPVVKVRNGVAMLHVVSSERGRYAVRAGVRSDSNEASTDITFLADVVHAGFEITGKKAVRVGEPVQLSATVKDGAGKPMANMLVYFRMVSGLASFPDGARAMTVSTDEHGVAGVEVHAAASGTNRIIATLVNNRQAMHDIEFSKKDSPALKVPADLSLTYDEDSRRATAVTAEVIAGGNGGTLRVGTDNPAVEAALTADRRVRVTVKQPVTGAVTVTVEQADTADTAAPQAAHFLVTVRPGAGGELKADMHMTAGGTALMKMVALHGGALSYALTDAGSTGAVLTGDRLSAGRAGTAVVTATESRAGYAPVHTVIRVWVERKASPALRVPADLSLTYDARRATAVTAEAIAGGNGGTLRVRTDSPAVEAALTADRRVRVTVKQPVTGAVTVTVEQADTADTAAPQAAHFLVTVQPGKLTALKLEDIKLDVGETSEDNGVVKLENEASFITGTLLHFTSGDKAKVDVDAVTGKVTALAAGSTYITVTLEKKNYQTLTQQYRITTTDKVNITFEFSGKPEVSPGRIPVKYTPLTAVVKVNGMAAPDDDLMFVIEPALIVKESVQGKETRLTRKTSSGQTVINIGSRKTGTFNIKAKYRGKESATLEVVFDKYHPVLVTPHALDLIWSDNLVANTTEEVLPDLNWAWHASSSDQSVIANRDISITPEGRISMKVLKPGKATISLVTNATEEMVEASASFNVTVSPGVLPQLHLRDLTLRAGEIGTENQAIALSRETGFISGTVISYTSGDDTIASVDGATGKVMGIAAGTTYIDVKQTRVNYADKVQRFRVVVVDHISVSVQPEDATVGCDESRAVSLTAHVTRNGSPVTEGSVTFRGVGGQKRDFGLASKTELTRPLDRNGNASLLVWGKTRAGSRSYNIQAIYQQGGAMETLSNAVRVTVEKPVPTISMAVYSDDEYPSQGRDYQWRTVYISTTGVDTGQPIKIYNLDNAITGGSTKGLKTNSEGKASFRVESVRTEKCFIAEVAGVRSNKLCERIAYAPVTITLTKDRNNDNGAHVHLTAKVSQNNAPVTEGSVTFVNKNGALTSAGLVQALDSKGEASIDVWGADTNSEYTKTYGFTATFNDKKSSEVTFEHLGMNGCLGDDCD